MTKATSDSTYDPQIDGLPVRIVHDATVGGADFLGFVSQEHEKEPLLTTAAIGGVSTLTGTAAAGQAVVPVTLGTKFVAGQTVQIGDSATDERNTVLSVLANNVTMVNNLANTYTTGRSGNVSGMYVQAAQDRFSYPYFPYTVRGKGFTNQTCTLTVRESENADKSSATVVQVPISIPASTTTILTPFQLTKRYFWYELVNTAATPATVVALSQGVGVSQPVTTSTMFNEYSIVAGAYTGIPMHVYGYDKVALSLVTSAAITGTATLSFEATIDGTNYVPLTAVTNISSGIDSTSIVLTSSMKNGYVLDCSGFKYIQAKLSAGGSGSGTVTVFGRALA